MPAAPLVTLEHVDVKLAGSPVLHDVGLTIERGEHWGIVGANGSGKSTLLGLIAGTVWPTGEHGTRRYDFGSGTETDAVRAHSEIVLVGHELQDRSFARGQGGEIRFDPFEKHAVPDRGSLDDFRETGGELALG